MDSAFFIFTFLLVKSFAAVLTCIWMFFWKVSLTKSGVMGPDVFSEIECDLKSLENTFGAVTSAKNGDFLVPYIFALSTSSIVFYFYSFVASSSPECSTSEAPLVERLRFKILFLNVSSTYFFDNCFTRLTEEKHLDPPLEQRCPGSFLSIL